ncbi:MAG: transporter substrate-binding domain-containing protein, partial [Kangiellaceae bacterium]|nr:transporter substrate-binding domain-containing protein [Kangiellaceae bacterium]
MIATCCFLVPTKLSAQLASRIDYTQEELEWIQNNPVIYYSDDNSWEPFVNLNRRGQMEGISVDYLNLIQEKTGLEFKFIKSDTWSQVIERLKRKQIKLVLAAIHAQERDAFADFTDAYFSSPLAIITGPDYSYVHDIEELYGRRVAIPRGYYSVSYLQKNHPGIDLVFVDSLDQALQAVADKNVDAFIGNLAVAIFKLRQSKLTNLKISGTIEEDFEVRMMVTKDNLPLISIINKTLERISDSEKRMIANSWFNVAIETGFNPETIWKASAMVVLVLFMIFLWVIQLRNEIERRQKTEEQLILAREDAEKANRAKSEFLANMSHEIRTPMNAVFGYSQLLSETKLDKEQKSYLDAISVGTNGLLHIINDILEISKIEAGKMTIEPGPVDVRQLITEVYQLFKDPMFEKGLEYSTRIDEEVPQFIISDNNRIRQILINLIGNAFKFTNQGRIELVVDWRAEREENSLEFRIIDSGIGIEKERYQSIFEHFEYQVNPSESHIASSGLGLSICKKLAEKLGGKILLESEIGKGSCFSLVLRKVKISPAGLTDVERTTTSFRPATLLIVDDVKSNRFILRKYCASYGFNLLEAENGQQAIDAATSQSFDLILMDIRMPEM